MGQQQCIGVSIADSAEDSNSSDELGPDTAHAQEVRKKVSALTEKYGWQTDPEVEEALARTDLPTYRRILERHRSAEPCWDEAVHGAFSGDRRVQSLAVGGFVFENLSVYMVLVQLLHPALTKQKPRVLDVGCGTGFLTAVLARLVAPRGGTVVAIDLFARQVEHAQRTMTACCPELLPYVTFAVANGLEYRDPRGLPFDAIAVACQATEVPQGLVQQLAPGGHLVVPVGRLSLKDSGKARPHHKYWLVKKGADGIVNFSGRAGPISVNFVPLLPSVSSKQESKCETAAPASSTAPSPAAAPATPAPSLARAVAPLMPPQLAPQMQVAGIHWPVHTGSQFTTAALPGSPPGSISIQPRGCFVASAPVYSAPWNGVRLHPVVGR